MEALFYSRRLKHIKVSPACLLHNCGLRSPHPARQGSSARGHNGLSPSVKSLLACVQEPDEHSCPSAALLQRDAHLSQTCTSQTNCLGQGTFLLPVGIMAASCHLHSNSDLGEQRPRSWEEIFPIYWAYSSLPKNRVWRVKCCSKESLSSQSPGNIKTLCLCSCAFLWVAITGETCLPPHLSGGDHCHRQVVSILYHTLESQVTVLIIRVERSSITHFLSKL